MILGLREWLSALCAWARRQPRAVRVGGGVVLLCLGWVLYVPTLAQARQLIRERTTLRASLEESQEILARLRRGEVRILPSIQEAPAVLSQIQALARTQEIRFLEISPGQPRPSGKDQPVILPVEIHLEGAYRPLGKFLSSLRQFRQAAVLVRKIRVVREEQRLPQLRARVSLDLAFLPGDARGL